MTTTPTLVLRDKDGDTLSVWPAIDGHPPAIQIDSGKRSAAVELGPGDANLLCEAIKKAAN